MRHTALILASLAVFRSVALGAQCPDGSPPPCGKAPVRQASKANVDVSRRVVVMPFAASTQDRVLADVGHMAADILSGQLARTGLLDVISPAVSPRAPEATGGSDGLQLARELRARWIIDGTVYRLGDSLQLMARILDAQAGRVATTLGPYRAAVTAPHVAIAELGRQVMPALATRTERTLANWANRVSAPPDMESYLGYTQGVRLFMQRRSREAIPLYRDMIARDSSFIAAHLWLATVYWDVGEMRLADSVATAISSRAHQLTEVEQLWVEWIHASTQGRLDAAYEASIAKNRVAPGSDLFEAITAYDAYRTGRPRAAIALFSKLDPRSSWMKETVIYAEYFTAALHVVGDYARELAIAREARTLHATSTAPTRLEVRALAALGRVDEVRAVISQRGGGGTPELNRLAAIELDAHGDSVNAAAFRAAAIEGVRSALLAQPQSQPLRTALARLLYEAGDLEEAGRLYQALSDAAPADLEARARLGSVAARRGDPAAADSADRWLASIQRPYLNGANTLWRARLAAARGQRDLAVALIGQARSEGASFTVNLHADADFARALRGHPAFEALLSPRQ